MTQVHTEQYGTFHITTNTKKKVPWLTTGRIPEILIDNLVMTRNVYNAHVYAFCMLPDHMHILIQTLDIGISQFMHSFKRNAMRDIRLTIRSGRSRSSATGGDMEFCWQKGFHDERIQSNDQRSNALRYIIENPLHHHLVDDFNDWPWTSLHFEHVLDEMEM